MTQEALKLALEALERSVATCFDQYAHQQVMSQPDHFINQAITAIKETLAQTQEPVAWVSEDVCKGQYIDGRPRKIWWECEKGVGTAFYITPPQRTWVGLTKKEILLVNEKQDESIIAAPDDELIQFARAIEAKLKQKNHVAQETN